MEQAQFAAQGKVLVVADSLDVAEVTAQFPIGTMLTLVPRDLDLPLDAGAPMPRLRDVAASRRSCVFAPGAAPPSGRRASRG